MFGTLTVTLFYYFFIFYVKYTFYVVLTLSALTVIFKQTRTGTKLNYYLFWAIYIFYFWSVPGIDFPILAVRPKHWQNARIMAWFLRKVSYLLGCTFEVRGERYAKEDVGGIICCNHQSALDILGDMNCGKVYVRRGTIAKKSLLYIVPLGPASWLSNIIFIDRSNKKASYNSLQNLTNIMTNDRMKILFYPEGTRNADYGFLPFRKGAFITAIQAQVPIFPMVYSPYYYLDHKKKIFLYENKHHIVSCLEKIPTKGLTEADTEDLMKKTYDAMLKEYEKLSEEVKERAKDKNWINLDRPRLTVLD